MKYLVINLIIVLTTITIIISAGDKKNDHEKLVRGLMEAFNAHDTESLLNYVTEDAKWLYIITPDSVSVETSGKKELREALIDYFKSVPSIRSEIEDLMVSGDYVTLRERVFWEREEKELSQSSLSVYQINDNKIRNVWYFPAEK